MLHTIDAACHQRLPEYDGDEGYPSQLRTEDDVSVLISTLGSSGITQSSLITGELSSSPQHRPLNKLSFSNVGK